MRPKLGVIVGGLLVLCIVGLVVYKALGGAGEGERGQRGDSGPVAVEVAPITSGTVREMRVYAGTLEASLRFSAVAKIAGRVEAVQVDIGDAIEKGQTLAVIDDAEYLQAVVQAQAELSIEAANQSEAESGLALAKIEHERAVAQLDLGLDTQARVDQTRSALETSEARVELARAQVQRAASALSLAQIQLGYTEVLASWSEDVQTAMVATRYADTGATVAAGDPIVDVVTLDPIVCVMTVPERDYSRLAVGQSATITTDSAAGEEFTGRIVRLAPVFDQASRQARVELQLDNPDRRLKPGAFARVQVVLGQSDAKAVVPSDAVTRRGDEDVLFLVDEDGGAVRQQPVVIGLREADRVEVTAVDGGALTGRVVTLGQQLLADGSSIRIVSADADASAAVGAAEPAP